MTNIKEICEKDNQNQRWFKEGRINIDTYNKNRQQIHKDYTDAVSEEEYLNNLIKKHGGN